MSEQHIARVLVISAMKPIAIAMKKKQESLLALIGVHVTKFGFARARGQQDFLKRFEYGTQALHLSFIRHQTSFDVVVNVAIRFDAVENLLDEYAHSPSARKFKTYTLGCELGNLVEGRQHRWTVDDESDLIEISKSIADFFVQHGLRYLKNYSAADSAFNLLTSNDHSADIHAPFPNVRAKKVIGLAVALNKLSQLEDIVAGQRRYLASAAPDNIEEFEAFVEKLGIDRRGAGG